MPVGRFVLDVHGESASLWPASDAICASLQIINHLQDCGQDYARLDRIYLSPRRRWVAPARTSADLAEPRASPALRAAIGTSREQAGALLDDGAGLAAGSPIGVLPARSARSCGWRALMSAA